MEKMIWSRSSKKLSMRRTLTVTRNSASRNEAAGSRAPGEAERMRNVRPTEGVTRLVDCDLSHARAVAVEAAEAAGSLVRARLFQSLDIQAKGESGDVVTELDFTSEKLIVGAIQQAFPGHRIISEEMGEAVGAEAEARWTWLIDPVDGTNNVVIGLPVLAIGIALCRDGVPVMSVVHDPVSRRTWSAIHRQGAWDAGGRLFHTPQTQARPRPLLAWIQGYSVARDDAKAQALRMVLSHVAHRVLDLWAPLTCWTMLARGDIDGIVGYRIGEIDLHAGALIATEAGLRIQDFSGVPFASGLHGPGDEQCLVAGSARVVAELARVVPAAARLERQLGRLRIGDFIEGG
ncbi:myo-inositol-1(or 4)-monophosphatase [Streptacidiphilus sp. MAP12-20]|uniref:inositol monophosphatase family protein n=1 Tax=Streptacidiphilus sp. MAP12-20 TaxID=3156299 RepID=UPI003514969A